MDHHETAPSPGTISCQQAALTSAHVVPRAPVVDRLSAMEAATSQERDWSSLPVDVLAQILSPIKWSNHPSFGLVCRRWQSARALSPFFPAWITPLLLSATDVGTTNFRYYSPYYHKNFEVDTKLEAPGAKIYSAAGGLHLTLGSLYKVLSAELGTGAMSVLPPITRAKFDFAVYDGVGRTMYGVNAIGGLTVSLATRHSNGEWGEWEVWDIVDFVPGGTSFTVSPDCNPVLHDGLLYLLGDDGRLVVYNGSRHGQRFEILEKPCGFGFECQDSYLFESDRGELMAVLVGHRGTPVNVVKLNRCTMEWEKTESLQGRALFTGTLTTMMKRTNIEWMQDKVFFPRLFNWPETIDVDLVQRDNELAFVPKLAGYTHPTTKDDCYDTNMWTHGFGQGEEARAFWGTETE